MLSRRHIIIVAVAASAASVAAVLIGLTLFARSPGEAGSADETRAAANDAEWLAIIEQARQSHGLTDAPWPEPEYQDGPVVLHSCSDVPANARNSGGALEYSPDGSRRRVLIDFVTEENVIYQLILYEGGDPSGCEKDLADLVSGPDVHRTDVETHLCEEMALMADGREPTDPTLRPASAVVAITYLDAFCKSQ